MSCQKREEEEEEEENTAGIPYTPAICAVRKIAVVVSHRKGWVVWLPRCVRKEGTKEKSRHTFYARGVSRLWFAAVEPTLWLTVYFREIDIRWAI